MAKKKKQFHGQDQPVSPPQSPKKEAKTQPGQALFDLFASVKLSFALLLVLAVASIAGTVIPQNEPMAFYVQAYGQNGARAVSALGLHDMYHAWWFLMLLSMLSANLVVCSLDRIPRALKIIKKDAAEDLKRKARTPKYSFTVGGIPAASLALAEETLTKHLGKKAISAKDQDRCTVFAQKGAWSRLGVYVVHLSVLIILAGGMVGLLWGYKTDVNVDEGQSIDSIRMANGEVKKLGFELRVDKFTISKYPNSNMVSEYRSDVTVIEGGKEIKKAALIVNNPLEHKDIFFYQASYGQRPGKFIFNMAKGGKTREVVLNWQAWTPLAGGGVAGVRDYHDNVNMGNVYRGPMAKVLYHPGNPKKDPKQTVELAAFAAGSKAKGMMGGKGPVRFEIKKVETSWYTGLSVKYDPGVWLIYIGCTTMIIGFLITFYLSHRKVWIHLEPTGKGRARVNISGSTNKNRPGLNRLLARAATGMGYQERQEEE